ncbi:L-lactate dehydrogenase [Enterococcus dongliensis]|uniref:L-lactate dehydrogenase n=1 Tax=Enterococcus dongliensis TaxID=2559925 RepID=A0AAP5NJD6_9ENTE|nr:L-lactate dehydrogenase [Enterococcus dongliensis]MDT2597952.1 L-lactate dehydrogenase [Enterococcus dongliensis]MDT2604987.1 L-lactate dehydrogenase [Enterococcus dongliensis]MDT2634283.1 L-lactate dehydrogenase [Enterococcus dongliensis]MDT2636800.1 L-lactate dehydrogenase [Enterococcus dongliensis]MDT2639298.1 L-lactate dehydrogenase [Enterococcus dongliensis]
MKKVAIIGVGHVGSTTAYTLISKNIVDELVLFDPKKNIIEAELNDLMDGQMEQEHQVRLIAPDLAELADTDVIIFSAGDITIFEGNSDRFAELNLTKKIAEEWAPKIKASGFKGILLNITNPCDVITQYLQELTGLPQERVLGTGTSLDTGRMKHAVSQDLNIHPSTIDGFVVGEHGESQFVAWSSLKINDVPITDLLDSEKLTTLEQTARNGGWITFRGKGYTSYGIAIQAARIAEAFLTNHSLIVPVSHYHSAENCYVGSPATISKQGLIKSFPLHFSETEQIKWQQTIKKIYSMNSTI